MRATSTFCIIIATTAPALLVDAVYSERLLVRDVPVVGLGFAAPIANSTGGSSSFSASGDEHTSATIDSAVEADLVQTLEADKQVTVVAPVEVGEVLCDTLEQAEDAAALSFVLRQNETITAERSSYTATDGGAFTDNIGRKVWTGIVVDPVQAEDEAVPRTVSMIWGDVCDTETFLLKVTTRSTDGTTRLLKTVPCDGSSTHTCLVEVSVEFDESGDAIIPDKTSGNINSFQDGAELNTEEDNGKVKAALSSETASTGDASVSTSGGTEYSSDTAVIDVMVLYSTSALNMSGVTGQQMETIILESLVGTNQAFANSGVSASVNPVHIGPLPYEVATPSSSDALLRLRLEQDVADLRDEVGADLVQLIGYFAFACGRGYLFADDSEEYGFSVVSTSCLDNFSHTHEFGHNLGCYHNREDTANTEDYAHGHRHCDGDERYETLMSYSCGSTRVNYFSNPDVSYNGRPTGTSTENNARAIENNMVAVSNYREGSATIQPVPATPTPPAPSPTPAPVVPTDSAYFFYVGCYEDDNEDYPVLSGGLLQDDVDMTIEVCATFCEGFPYFGTRDGTECVCGTDSDEPLEEEAETCNSECAGDMSQICGDRESMSVYEYGRDASEIAPSQYRGCWTDVRAGRIMAVMQARRSMTNDRCATICQAYPFYGLQYGRECWCGNESTDYAEHGNSTTCDTECSGDADTLCGGYYSMAVFEYERP